MTDPKSPEPHDATDDALGTAAWRTLVDALPHGVLVCRLDDPDATVEARIVAANAAIARDVGRDVDALVGRTLAEALPDLVDTAAVDGLREARITGVEVDLGVVERGDAPVPRGPFAARAIPLGGADVALLLEDLSVQQRVEAQTRELSRFLDCIVENIPTLVAVKDAKTLRYELVNRAFEEVTGFRRTDLIGATDADVLAPEAATRLMEDERAILEDGRAHDIPEQRVVTGRGERWLHARKVPILDDDGRSQHLVSIAVDVTEHRQAEEARRAHEQLFDQRTAELVTANERLRREVEERKAAEAALRSSDEQLRERLKMEAIGRLAGGVAHDFNNIVSVILGYSSIVLEDLPPDDPMRVDIDEIRRAGERAASLTRQLLAFGRKQVLEPRVVDMNEILASMGRMLRRLIGEDVSLDVRAAPDLARVKVDPSQLEQVIMNLAVNARDAMPRGGRVTIETSNLELLEPLASAGQEPLPPGAYAVLAVTDTGHGMDEDTAARIFEPFFTTKNKARGTGLGLATVLGIVQQSGGTIAVESVLGRGTTFRVCFPRTLEPPTRTASGAWTVVPSRATDTVLLVEDEASVRMIARGILERSGYQVLEAREPAHAIEICETHTGPIHLLLTDVVMPGMSGPELAAQLTQVRPGMGVLFMTGYTDDAIVHHGVRDGSTSILQKPFTPTLLLRKVREALMGG